jgi:translocator protein
MKNKWLVLAALIVLCVGVVGGGAGFFTAAGVTTWFPTLVKPSFNPPAWVFAPVWTILYLMMAVAAWLVWQRGNSRSALTLFFIQLALNFAWSFLFFGAKSPALALVDIIALWLAIVATMLAFWNTTRPAGLLLVPYLAWVSFATALNASIWYLN